MWQWFFGFYIFCLAEKGPKAPFKGEPARHCIAGLEGHSASEGVQIVCADGSFQMLRGKEFSINKQRFVGTCLRSQGTLPVGWVHEAVLAPSLGRGKGERADALMAGLAVPAACAPQQRVPRGAGPRHSFPTGRRVAH